MKNHETVRLMTKGQKNDLAKTMRESVPEMSFEDANTFLSNKGLLVAELRSIFEKCMPSSLVNRQLAKWREIYKNHFGVDLGSVQIPTHRKGFDRLIIIAHGLSIQQTYDVCASLFSCLKSTDRSLNEAVPTNDRMPTVGTYAIWVRDRIEADEELKNLSANNLAVKGTPSETIMERELHEIVYFLETGRHLDLHNVTLASGSRSGRGYVPRADWHDGKFYVGVIWYSPDDSDGALRARQVVF